MSIFTNLLKEHKEKNKTTYLQHWLSDTYPRFGNVKEHCHSEKGIIMSTFVVLMLPLIGFPIENPNKDANDIYDTYKHHHNDASFFELGCYLMCRIDMWFFQNKPELRERLVDPIFATFASLFNKALKIENAGDLFNQRAKIYGELTRSKNSNHETFHHYITGFIYETKGSILPKEHKTSAPPLGDIFATTFLKIDLTNWELKTIPLTFKVLESYTGLIEMLDKHNK